MNWEPRHGNTAIDATFVTGICFGCFILTSIQAVALHFPTRPFTDSGFLRLIVFEFGLGAIAVAYLRTQGYNLAQLVPVPTAKGCLVGLALYAGTAVVTWLIETALAPTLSVPQPIEQMIAGARISFFPLTGMSIVNGLYEETFLVGYLQRALERHGVTFAISVSVLVRVLYHLYQGPIGAISTVGVGIAFSVYFFRTRNLWPIVFAHMVADVAGFSLSWL